MYNSSTIPGGVCRDDGPASSVGDLACLKYLSIPGHMVKPGIPEFRIKNLNALHVVKLLSGCVRLAS